MCNLLHEGGKRGKEEGSWGAIFSMRGGKGERKRGKEGREGGGKKGVKVQIEEGNSNFTARLSVTTFSATTCNNAPNKIYQRLQRDMSNL